MENKVLLDEFYVRAAFKRELASITDQSMQRLAVEMLRRAHPRNFTGPSSSSGRFHPKDEYFSGPKGDISGAPPNRGKEYGGQVLHNRRVFKFTRHLLKAHMYRESDPEYQLALACALVHDIAQYQEGQKGTVRFHEALVRELTEDIPILYPELASRWEALIRLCEVHSGQWGRDESLFPATDLELLVHSADYLASRRETGGIDPELDDWSR